MEKLKEYKNIRASSIYGCLTFNKKAMREKLSGSIYEAFFSALEKNEPLTREIAAPMAHAMKEWAMENGATHFSHWFQPMRGTTAEKHDAFITYDEVGDVIERFSEKQLIQSEPDASSFPSGGIRSTFEARGYTAWDPTSPAFLYKSKNATVLAIPSVFLSWTGHALDIKTPHLRSIAALEKEVVRLQKLLGNRNVKRVHTCLGAEQEYFLIDKDLWEKRPDLKTCSRTLFGAMPAKGQQMEDHYFGTIKQRILDFMGEVDMELYKRGIPAKTRHNEVAPRQFEIAPLYEESNLACDHNRQLMDLMESIGEKHGLVALFYEKPFSGVNGSGKHINWSIGDNTGTNYLEPSASPLRNITFLLTIGAILYGVHKHSPLLRIAVSDAGNDHRLGACEAPPAIMSVYLGEYISGILKEIEGEKKFSEKKLQEISLGIRRLPNIVLDTSDRNRTSPIAFTGNKFEFRTCGASQNCAVLSTAINLIVAEGFNEITSRIQAFGYEKKDIRGAALVVLGEISKETMNIRFEGNNYAEEWLKEAEKRGLPNIKNTPQAYEMLCTPANIALFEKHKVLSRVELESKKEIMLAQYVKTKDIEFKVAFDIAKTMIKPAVLKQLGLLNKAMSESSSKTIKEEYERLGNYYEELCTRIEGLEKDVNKNNAIEDIFKKSYDLADNCTEKYLRLREIVDKIETEIASEFWPLPRYRELLDT